MIDKDSAAEYLILLTAFAAWVLTIATCDRRAQAQDVARVRELESAASAIVDAVRPPDGAAEGEEQLVDAAPSAIYERARAFILRRPDGPYRLREPGAEEEVRTVVRAAEIAAEGREWPDASLLLALAWRESRWRPTARGARGEVGLAQLHPRYTRGPLDTPEANLCAAAAILTRYRIECGSEIRALRAYGKGGRCGPGSSADRMVLKWAKTM